MKEDKTTERKSDESSQKPDMLKLAKSSSKINLLTPILYGLTVIGLNILYFHLSNQGVSTSNLALIFVFMFALSIILVRRIKNPYIEAISLCAFAESVLMLSQVIIAVPLVVILGNNANDPVWTMIYQALVYTLSALVVILYSKKFISSWKTNREELGLKGLPTFTDIGLGIAGFILTLLISGVVSNVMTQIFPWFDVNETQNVGYDYLSTGLDRAVAFIALVIIAPIAEELVFRGWLYGKLRKKHKIALSLILTSVLFGALHGQWNVGVTVGIMSTIMCAQREITGTAYSGMITHMLKNGVAFYILYILA